MPSRTHFSIVLGTLLTLSIPGIAFASEEIAASEGDKECSVCHVDVETDLLTDRGKYYQMMRTLEGYEAVLERFGECTYCHVKEAGSLAMTDEGQRFKWMMEDMKGLKAWLAERHPKAEGDEEGEDAE